MIRIVLGAVFAATLAATGLAQISQTPAWPLAGKAGQTMALADSSMFGGPRWAVLGWRLRGLDATRDLHHGPLVARCVGLF